MATLPSSYSTTNPRAAANNAQNTIQAGAQSLNQQNNQELQQAQQNLSGTAQQLNSLEDPLAAGQGGYTQQEVSQIEMSPEQQQQLIANAGISAGAANTAGLQQATQAANAVGGNPSALMAYTNRVNQQNAANAGNAATNARVQAQQALSGETQQVGNAQLAQQNQGLSYLQGQNAQANQNAQNALQRNEQTYGTQTGGTNQATGNQINASQTPSTFDKIMGFLGGLEDGVYIPHYEDGTEPAGGHHAIVGEGGPERIVNKYPYGARYAENGTVATMPHYGDGYSGDAGAGWPNSAGAAPPVSQNAPNPAPTPFWKQLGGALQQRQQQQVAQGGMAGSSGSTRGGSGWNPTTPYSQVGNLAGSVASAAIPALAAYLEDGGVMSSFAEDGYHADSMNGHPQGTNGLFTKPTHVALKPGDAVVPLSHKPHTAKVRPSMAMMPPAVSSGGRKYYGAT
jgi:hypothetical protein